MSTDAGQPVGRPSADAQFGDTTPTNEASPPTKGPGVVAELHLDHDNLLLRSTLRALDDVTAIPEYRAHGERGVYQFVSFPVDDEAALCDAFERDATVRNPVLVDRDGDRLVYRLDVTDDAIDLSGSIAEKGGRILEATGSKTAWVFQLRFPSREALVEFNNTCKRNDVSVQVTHLRSADDGPAPVLGLTAKQEELLSVAFEEGYFEVPRGISQDELAGRLGVSKSAISQRLRRAMTELCASSLSSSAV